jgi:hypothetical protein
MCMAVAFRLISAVLLLARLARGSRGRKVLRWGHQAVRSPEGRKLIALAREAARDPKNRQRLRELIARHRMRA